MSHRRTTTVRGFPIRPLWTSTTSQPTLDLGLAVIPAWLLPLLIASTFVYFKTTSRRRKDSFLAAARRYLPDTLLAFRIVTFCQVAYNRERVLEQGKSIIIIAEFLALVLDHSFLQQADLWASILTAAGWVLLLDVSPDPEPYTTIRLYAVGFLAVSGCVGFPPERRNAGPLISSMSLMAAVMSYSWVHEGPGLTDRMPKVFDAILAALVMITVWKCLWPRLSQTAQGRALNLHHCIFSILVYWQIIAAGVLVSSYLWSCLGWKFVSGKGKGSSPPGATQFSLLAACLSYLPAWYAVMYAKHQSDVWRLEREYSFATRARSWLDMATDAFGWTILAYCFVWCPLYCLSISSTA